MWGGAQGVTYQLTQGVTKNIIPAIPSTNAIVAAASTLEALKIITDVSVRMDNYMMCAPAPRTPPPPPPGSGLVGRVSGNPLKKRSCSAAGRSSRRSGPSG